MISFISKISESKFQIRFPISTVKAGFPSPAGDYEEPPISLDKILIKNPNATFILKISGDSMNDAGIRTDDLILVDCSLFPRNKDIVVAVLENEFTVKYFQKDKTGIYLAPANDSYPVIDISKFSDSCIWGVVTSVIRQTR
jgi:DNA polymerase V